MAAKYFCGRRERRDLVRASPDLNGIDYLEVIDAEAPTEELRQLLLVVRLLDSATDLGTANLRLAGGVRIVPVHVLWAFPLTVAAPEIAHLEPAEQGFFATYRNTDPERHHFLVVRADVPGDFSTYRLRLVAAAVSPHEPDPPPPPDFDPRLAEVEFSFKVECPSEFDCKAEDECPPPELVEPPIDYLAKDYASFRRLIFDRLAAIAPQWRERNPADLGVALGELLAYTGDQLSYFQDAVATEAYLGTARQRISVRRHARLVDYFLDEGRSARTWVHFTVDGAVDLLGGTPLSTRFAAPPPAGENPQQAPEGLREAVRVGAVIFETLHAASFHLEMNELAFYTWSDSECCLGAGATAATLRRALPGGGELSDQRIGELAGSFLLFEEVLGPQTGVAADADPTHRHVVRVTRAWPVEDPLDGTRVVEIEWHSADALPFPLCLSARTSAEHGERFIDGVSVTRGNLALADHGRTVTGEELGSVPADSRFFRPRLAEAPLTHAVPLPEGFVPTAGAEPVPAAALFEAPSAAAPTAEPVVELISSLGETWTPRRDLLASGRFDSHFVAEIDHEGRAHMRFGDDIHAKRPDEGTDLVARYRVGTGPAGNVGADALGRVFVAGSGIRALRNPLPAAGGRAPASLEEARQYAPQAFRVQQRAVTEADYAWAAERHPEVQRAAATFRWTGSWHTVLVTVDRRGGRAVDAEFEDRLRQHLSFYRMAGYDLEVDGPRFVSLDLELMVCVEPGYLRSDVKGELLRLFSSFVLPDGRRGFFHPDNWTFGQPVYLSRIVAAASGVAGVASVVLERFQRWGRPEVPKERDDGVMPMDRLEIARLDNDANFQENGRLEIAMGGGQ